jgi:hypothetical protein
MLELLAFVTALAMIALLVRPFLRSRSLPAWLERARLRGRPGVPVTACLSAVVVMFLTWSLGDQHGIIAFLLWFVWIGAPLIACRITWLWIATSKEQGAKSKGLRA